MLTSSAWGGNLHLYGNLCTIYSVYNFLDDEPVQNRNTEEPTPSKDIEKEDSASLKNEPKPSKTDSPDINHGDVRITETEDSQLKSVNSCIEKDNSVPTNANDGIELQTAQHVTPTTPQAKVQSTTCEAKDLDINNEGLQAVAKSKSSWYQSIELQILSIIFALITVLFPYPWPYLLLKTCECHIGKAEVCSLWIICF